MAIEDKVRKEHDEIKRMAGSLADSGPEDAASRKVTLAELVQLITDHEEAEERTFYRAMRDDERLKELAMEGVEQHSIIETLLQNLHGVDVEDELWHPKLMAMKGILDSHMLVEERLLLPTSREVMGDEAMERLDREYVPVKTSRRVGVLSSTVR